MDFHFLFQALMEHLSFGAFVHLLIASAVPALAWRKIQRRHDFITALHDFGGWTVRQQNYLLQERNTYDRFSKHAMSLSAGTFVIALIPFLQVVILFNQLWGLYSFHYRTGIVKKAISWNAEHTT